MRTLKSLRREAAHTTNLRGHRMRWSIHHGERKSLAIGVCNRCEAMVTCSTKPAPNEIAIGGDAVALDCNGKSMIIIRAARKLNIPVEIMSTNRNVNPDDFTGLPVMNSVQKYGE